MRILNKYNLTEIKEYIINKAKYQKVIICVDDSSNLPMMEEIQSAISRDVVVLKYVYNPKTISDFAKMLNDGVRMVIYNVCTNNFCNLRQCNNFILNIFIPTSKYVLPYMLNIDCVYGDNILICNNANVDYASIIVLYYAGLNKVWYDLQAGEKVNLEIFKRIDKLANGLNNFYIHLFECVNYLSKYIEVDLFSIQENELPYNIYLKSCAIFNMLEKFNNKEENYIDFYKTQKSPEEILKAHKLIIKYELIDLIKYYCNNLLRLNYAILNRFKILIKKYFILKNINLNKINNNIKNCAKYSKIDNLLYISYIFNSI